jgi:hypothetical protein
MDELLIQIAAEKKKSSDLQISLDEEIALRLKAEASLHDLRKVLETMANRGEMEEEKMVNKVWSEGSYFWGSQVRNWRPSHNLLLFLCQLLTKITEAQLDKEKLAIDLEREEECLTNNLQRQLRKISIEKEETDAEVDDLKRQLEDMKTEREKVCESFCSWVFLFSSRIVSKPLLR